MSNHPPLLPPKGRILIADDDAAFRKPTAELLRRQGYEVECAADAETVKSLLREAEFDLLISDICMPGNSGLELIRDLPQLAAGLPVILMTGRPTVETAAESVRFAVVAYLVKPANFQELAMLVGQAVAQRRAWRAVNASRHRLEAWLSSLEHLETQLQKPSRASAASLMIASVDLSLQHVLSALSEVKLLTQALAQAENHGDTLTTVAFVRATRETVEVLHRTKQSFKCKELAELRRRLEGLLGTVGARPPLPASPSSGLAHPLPEDEEPTYGPSGAVDLKSPDLERNKKS